MFLKDTLYVRPRIAITRVQHEIAIGNLADTPYQVIDINYTDQGPYYGVICEYGYIIYLPHVCWLVLDSKTKQLVKNPKKEPDNVEHPI